MEELLCPLTGTLLSKRCCRSNRSSCGGFRPLTGTLLSKLFNDVNHNINIVQVSVPSRGLSYLNRNTKVSEKANRQGFRPHGDSLI